MTLRWKVVRLPGQTKLGGINLEVLTRFSKIAYSQKES